MADDYNNEEEIVEIIDEVLKDSSTGINARLPIVEARYSDYIELPAILDKNFFNTEDDSEWQEFPVINYFTTRQGPPPEGNEYLVVPVEAEVSITIDDRFGKIKVMSKMIRRYSAALFVTMREAFIMPAGGPRLLNVSDWESKGLVSVVFTGSTKRELESRGGMNYALQVAHTYEFRQIRE